MVIFHSSVKLPESKGKFRERLWGKMGKEWDDGNLSKLFLEFLSSFHQAIISIFQWVS